MALSCHGRQVRPRGLEVADLWASHLEAYEQHYALGPFERTVVRDLLRCRTAALGGHLEICSTCDLQQPAYNSCRNRHCPKCQGLAQARWVDRRMRRVLPTPYFHVVFTLPSELHALVRRNRALVLGMLLHAAAQTLLTLGRDPKWLGARAELAVTAVLHTWTRELRFHPHVHCIVSGGGLCLDEHRWIGAPGDFLFPVHVLGALFRGKLLSAIDRARRDGQLLLPPGEQGRAARRRLQRLHRTSWIVYAKRPFGGPEQVHRYLGRYTHRVAISNARLLRANNRSVTFRTRGDKIATLPIVDFLRRFLDHALPPGFVKIRHYGLLASGNVGTRLAEALALLEIRQTTPPAGADPGAPPAHNEDEHDELPDDWRAALRALTGIDVRRCPRCRALTLRRVALPSSLRASARSPPTEVRS